jgi:hypothetical protein
MSLRFPAKLLSRDWNWIVWISLGGSENVVVILLRGNEIHHFSNAVLCRHPRPQLIQRVNRRLACNLPTLLLFRLKHAFNPIGSRFTPT